MPDPGPTLPPVPARRNWTPDAVRALRDGLGETLATFAERVGVSRLQTVHEWERGTRTPSGSSARLLDTIAAAAYGDERGPGLPSGTSGGA